MSAKLLILADVGRFKAYRMEENREFSHPRLELLEDTETNVARHLSQEMSDHAGQFRRGVAAGGEGGAAMSGGEDHNLDLERRRRVLKAVARRMSELLNREKTDAFYFAADPQINRAILDQLDGSARSKLQKNVTANLTKMDSGQIIRHFSGASLTALLA